MVCDWEGGWEGWSWIVLGRGAESKKGIQDFQKKLYVCDKCLISERSTDKMLVFCAPVAHPVHIWLPSLDPSRSIVDIFAAEVNLVPTLFHCVQVLHAQLNHNIHFIMFFFPFFFLFFGLWIMTLSSFCVGVWCTLLPGFNGNKLTTGLYIFLCSPLQLFPCDTFPFWGVNFETRFSNRNFRLVIKTFEEIEDIFTLQTTKSSLFDKHKLKHAVLRHGSLYVTESG